MMGARRAPLCALGRWLLLVSLAASLAACGFRLRGDVQLPFKTVYISAGGDSAFAAELARLLEGGSKVRITSNPEEADAVIQILAETREKQILTLTRAGTVGEFLLRYRINYRVYDHDKRDLAPPTEILLVRDYSFNSSQVLAKETEETLLYRDMQNDAVQQLLRRLQLLVPIKS
jgi:LPS-assembly lipoprotein